MKTYWDYTEYERGQLTYEQVEALSKVEMMTNGIVIPLPPQLEEVPPEPSVKPKQYYRISKNKYSSIDLAFESADDAATALRLSIGHIDYDYEGKKHYISTFESAIEAIECYSAQDWINVQGITKQRAAIIKRNEKMAEEYSKALSDAEKSAKAMWDDWQAIQEEKHDAQVVLKTYKEYQTISGDDSIALRFLNKAYSEARLIAAEKWLDVKLLDATVAHPLTKVDSVTDSVEVPF